MDFIQCFHCKTLAVIFLNDDFMHIPDVRLVLRSGFMRPVPNIFIWLDKKLYGNGPLGFFITSILLHGVAVFSAYYLVDTIQKKLNLLLNYRDLPFWVSLFFLVYPFHAESIMWTIARVSIMATAFTLFSLACFIKADNLKKTFWFAWLWLLLALFSYESMWNIIPLFFLIAWYKFHSGIIQKQVAVIQSGVMAATFGVYLLIRLGLLSSLVGDGYEDMESNLKNLPLIGGNLVKLTARIFTPALDNPILFTSLFLLLSLFFLYVVIRFFKANRTTGIFLIILWGAMISGVITAAPLGIDTHFHESDRYTYYASFFFCLFIAILCQSFSSTRIKQLLCAALCLIFVIGFYLLQRDYAYSSSVTKGTVHFLNSKPPVGKRWVFIDVPERYQGALIFRTSLPQAVNWLYEGQKPDTVIIYSQTRGFTKKGDFITGNKSSEELQAEKGQAFMNDLKIFLNQSGNMNTALFWYGKGGLWRINP